MQHRIGVVESGGFTGKKIILPVGKNPSDSVWLIEEGRFMGDQPIYHKACLMHEKFVEEEGCEECNK